MILTFLDRIIIMLFGIQIIFIKTHSIYIHFHSLIVLNAFESILDTKYYHSNSFHLHSFYFSDCFECIRMHSLNMHQLSWDMLPQCIRMHSECIRMHSIFITPVFGTWRPSSRPSSRSCSNPIKWNTIFVDSFYARMHSWGTTLNVKKNAKWTVGPCMRENHKHCFFL